LVENNPKKLGDINAALSTMEFSEHKNAGGRYLIGSTFHNQNCILNAPFPSSAKKAKR